jgi:hypothetical protein
VLHFDGVSWSRQDTPTQTQLTSVWGTSPSDVWACGFEGVVIHWDGVQWSDRSPPDGLFTTVDAGVPAADAGQPVRRNLWGIWAAGSNDVTEVAFVVGDRGTVFAWQTDAWIRVDSGAEEDLADVWGASAARVFAVGDFGTILEGSVAGFAKMQTGVSTPLRGVWGRGGSDVFVVGVNGTILRFDGSRWLAIGGAPRQVLRQMWGAPNDRANAYVVGWDGLLMRLTGGPGFTTPGFELLSCVTKNRLESIWGTLVDGPIPDAGVLDARLDVEPPQVPAVWAVGVSGTVITGP